MKRLLIVILSFAIFQINANAGDSAMQLCKNMQDLGATIEMAKNKGIPKSDLIKILVGAELKRDEVTANRAKLITLKTVNGIYDGYLDVNDVYSACLESIWK